MPAGAEIERKFLVAEPPADLERHPSEPLRQGYVALDGGVEVRVRRKGDRHLLTIKSGSGRVRVEEELEIDERRFDALWKLTDGRRIAKTRHRVPLGGGLTAEVDVYEGELAGLVVAEVEFDSAEDADAFAAPQWLGREVTDDPRYGNRALAVDGRPGT
jgi:CYTH domain-containing protein